MERERRLGLRCFKICFGNEKLRIRDWGMSFVLLLFWNGILRNLRILNLNLGCYDGWKIGYILFDNLLFSFLI